MKDLKPVARKIAQAALTGWTDAEIAADPARAMLVAQDAARGGLQAVRRRGK